MGNSSAKPHRRSNQHKKQVHWKAADRPGPPGKPQLVSESELTPDVVTIRWDRPRFDGGSPIIGYLCEHRRYGSPHWVRATPQLVRFTELSLSGLEPGWRYQFRVSAENAVGLSVPGELSELLTVTLQRSAVTAPRFTDELLDTVVLENEKVEFTSHFLGQPAPKISWFKDGFEIFSSRRIRIVTENEKSTLTIHQSSLSDEGEIKCTATNRAGHVSTKSQLTLEAAPSIRLPRQYEDGLLFELEETIRLKVSVAGRPSPTISWCHNNEPINSNERIDIENTDKYSCIKIQAAQRTDRGEYQIKAVNKLGEAVSSFLVTVTNKPSPPTQIQVVMTLGKSVTLAWNVPPDDGGCKIGNYIVEYFRVGWDVWLKAATCRQLTTTIGDLIEGSEYKFRIKAESPYGISEPSNESDTVFIPDAKRGILSPNIRSQSQPRDILVDNHIPLPTKRKPRSLSSTRTETAHSKTPAYFYDGGIPKRPARTKIKSPTLSPEASPTITRRKLSSDINKHILDRTSVARDLAYGSPEIKVEKIKNEVPLISTEKRYHSHKLDEMPNSAVKSTVNVIHYQCPLTDLETKRNNSNTDSNTIKIMKNQEQNLLKNAETLKIGVQIPNENKVEKRDRSVSPLPRPSLFQVKEKSPSPLRSVEPPHIDEEAQIPKESKIITRERSSSPLPRYVKEKSPSPLRSSKSRSPSPNKYFEYQDTPESPDTSKAIIDKHSPLSNSSEFMLVLLPNNQKEKADTKEVDFSFDENSVPPPMSLSAPELGAEELVFQPLRCSVSSSELLYENALKRFQEFAEAFENDLKTETHFSKVDKKNIPKIQINSKDDQIIVGLERSNSLQRRSSGTVSVPQHLSWNYRRHSLKNASDNPEIPENTLRRYPLILDNKSEEGIKATGTNVNLPNEPLSTESKREMFAKRQRSQSEEREEEEFEKVRAKMANQKKEPKKTVAVVQETEWDDENKEHEESISVSESDSSEEYPPVERHSFRRYLEEEDEDIYHPGIMQRTAIITPKSSNSEPFEILTKPNPLPDPNFIPKPILKKKVKDIPDKPSRKSTDTNKLHQKLFPSTNSKEALGASSKPRPFSLFPQTKQSRKKTQDKEMFRKRSSSPAVPARKPPDLNFSAMGTGIQEFSDTLLSSVAQGRKAEEEIKVVVDHYGDIVRSYGQKNRPMPKVILNADDLKAAAEKQFEDESRDFSEPELDLEDLNNSTSLERKPSFIEASSALLKTVKDTVSAAFASSAPIEDDIIPPEAEILASMQRRGSSQINKRKTSKSLTKVDVSKANKKGGTGGSPRGENWSNLRTPSPGPQGKKSSPTTMRRNSLTPPAGGVRRNSPGSISPIPFAKAKVKESTTQTSKYDDPRLGIKQEEITARAELKVRTTMDYVTDLAMFIVACWLYFFTNELYAIPVLLVMVYRQLKEEIVKLLPGWMTGQKKVRRK